MSSGGCAIPYSLENVDPAERAGKDGERKDFPYIPELDGIRAFAVLAVVAFHAGFPGARRRVPWR